MHNVSYKCTAKDSDSDFDPSKDVAVAILVSSALVNDAQLAHANLMSSVISQLFPELFLFSEVPIILKIIPE